jgi:hypothetical protein
MASSTPIVSMPPSASFRRPCAPTLGLSALWTRSRNEQPRDNVPEQLARGALSFVEGGWHYSTSPAGRGALAGRSKKSQRSCSPAGISVPSYGGRSMKPLDR